MSSVVFSSALVGFCGPRSLPVGAAALVPALVASVLRSGRGVASGCAVGAGGRLSVFCAFGRRGLGAVPGCSVPLRSLSAVVAAGGSVSWWSGGGPVAGVLPPVPARLAARSLAFVRAVAASGSGSWASVGAAVLLGVPVVVFPCGWLGFRGAASLPSLPVAGSWAACSSSGLWSAGWSFVPAPSSVQASLFGSAACSAVA
ncbi:hypothetical protein KFU94_00895 [Chloroflexi bacterium TSY]|nr:hypothetical protein [Chloroflexi bacterium TSY]